MLTPDQLEALPRRFVQLWQQVEDDILQDIARRMKSLGELDPLTPTAIWQAWWLAETRAVRSNTVATLARYTGKSRAEIKRLLETAGAQTLAADDAVYTAAGLDPPPVNQSPALLNLLNAGYRQTCGTWQNLTATTANTVTGAFEDRLSRAWGLISTGALDYSTAIRRTVDDLADTMPYITYPSGHTDTLEVAARRAVLTGVNQTCAKLQLARMEEMDCEFVEVTAHEGARPTHAVWQGRVYHRGGAVVQDGERYEDFETATGYGTGPGLCGWNCRHNFYPFYPGISVRNYTAERLAELDARNIPYGGGLYTRYEITQMQRALERRVRKYKRRYLAETAAGVDASQSAAKLKAARQQLSAFLAETGERLDGARAGVPGENFSAKKQTAYAARKEQSALQKLNFADNVSQTERESIEKELSVIPKWQKNRAESIIDKVVMVDRNASGSGYSYKNRTLYVHPDRTAGDMIHEYGHALEISLKLIHNEKYIAVRRFGLELSDLSKIMIDDETFTMPITYLTNDKFVSIYQGRLYETEDYGIFKPDSFEVDESMLKEYFSEGYRAFYQEPNLLKEKDPLLYQFIEELSDDKE